MKPAVPRIYLIVLLLVFASLGTAYSLATRLKYGPDEPAHFIYIRSMGTHLSVPSIAHSETYTDESTDSHEAHQPPLYYALMAIPYAAMNALGAEPDTIWRILRLLNIPLGILWLCAVYALASRFFEDRARAIAGTAFCALIPTAGYTFGVINNENLITPLFTLALIPILGCFREGFLSRRSAVWLGIVMGLSILAKAQGLALVPIFLLALLLAFRRNGYGEWRRTLGTAGVVLGTAILISGWWFVRNYLAYDELMPHSLFKPLAAIGMDRLPAAALAATCLIYGYFWLPFWLVEKFVPFMDYLRIIGAASLVALTGLLLGLTRLEASRRRAFAFLLTAPVLLYVLWLRYLMLVDSGTNMQGRLFLSAAAVAGIAAAVALDSLPKRARPIVMAIAAAIVLAVNVWVLSCAMTLYSS